MKRSLSWDPGVLHSFYFKGIINSSHHLEHYFSRLLLSLEVLPAHEGVKGSDG